MTLVRTALVAAGLAIGWTAPAGAQSHDHSKHTGGPQKQEAPAPATDKPAGDGKALPPFIPPITDADRKAAFPDVKGHELHDQQINSFVLFDQLEWQAGRGANALNWDTTAWVGKDLDRLWVRTEGEIQDGDLTEAEAHVLYGRSVARWWDVVGGVRQDFRPGEGRTWAAFGLQGLAPYKFEVALTGYVGEGGRTAARLEGEYELLITNRLIAQPLVEAEFYGKDDPLRELGAGLSSIDAGLRLRYEFRREFAPYIGFVWNRKFGGTADHARDHGDSISSTRFVTGLRLWF